VQLGETLDPTREIPVAASAAPSPSGVLQWVYLGRVVLAIVMFVAAAFSFKAVPPETLVVLAGAAILSVMVSGWSAWYSHIRRLAPGQTFLYGQALFDLALVTTVVHVTEGPSSQFPALYVLVIAVSAVLMPFSASLLITALASLLYVGDILWSQPVLLTLAVWLQIAVFVGVFLVTGFIASRVRAVGVQQEELQQEVRRLRLEASDILGSMQSGVVTVDSQGDLVYANTAAQGLLGLNGEKDLGQPCEEVLKPRSPRLCEVILETQRRRVKTLRGEGVVQLPDRAFPIGVTTTSLDLESGETTGVAAIFTDISDQRRLMELRLRAERLEAVAELSASLAHEIKNPLASIRSSVEQLSKSARANDDERFLAGLVVRESDRLSGLLSEFLDFSRVRVTDCHELDLAQVAQGAVELVRRHPDCTNGAVIDVDAAPSPMEGDEDLLHRVVSNLVLNAVQAAQGDVQITVQVRPARAWELPPGFQSDSVVLKVIDNGPGIPAELRERMFEPFVTGRVGGSGLGLAIVQRAVLAHRGAVLVESTPGRETSFTVLLPTAGTTEVIA